MAAIVLDSNLITGDYGALPGSGTYYDTGDAGSGAGTVENEDGTFTIPKFQMESNTPTFDLSNMQNIYGTEYMPMFQWINKVQTGTYEYDPDEDTKEIDDLKEKFEREQGEAAEAALAKQKELYKQEALGVAGMAVSGVGAQLGRAYAANMGTDAAGLSGAFNEYSKGGPMQLLGFSAKNDPSNLTAKISDSGQFTQGRARFELANTKSDAGKAATAALEISDKNPLATEASQKYLESIKDDPAKTEAYKSALAVIPKQQTYIQGIGDRSGFVKGPDGKSMSAAGKANIGGAAGAGLTSVAFNLASGKNLKESVKAGAKTGLFTYVGGLFGPIGGLLGGILGGRVICNELMRQGIMTRKQVVLDYKFTEDYLTPQHVAGYHVWAVWMVRQMRKGRLVNFWKHVAGHRANEIAHIYGERDKPDYLGKVYRKVLEPICWSIGFFCKKTDWTVLYKEKEV
tara:strand:+ start:358 stop:1728 length:1371 start_codon:yes stop_codon:yes gene_type:complete